MLMFIKRYGTQHNAAHPTLMIFDVSSGGGIIYHTILSVVWYPLQPRHNTEITRLTRCLKSLKTSTNCSGQHQINDKIYGWWISLNWNSDKETINLLCRRSWRYCTSNLFDLWAVKGNTNRLLNMWDGKRKININCAARRECKFFYGTLHLNLV